MKEERKKVDNNNKLYCTHKIDVKEKNKYSIKDYKGGPNYKEKFLPGKSLMFIV